MGPHEETCCKNMLVQNVVGDVTKTGNGEWGMGNGEWGMGNGEWEIEYFYTLTFYNVK